MSFIVRTLARTVVSTIVTSAVTYGAKRVYEKRKTRKQAVPRVTDDRARKPAARAKADDA
jgi:hypothetical protein